MLRRLSYVAAGAAFALCLIAGDPVGTQPPNYPIAGDQIPLPPPGPSGVARIVPRDTIQGASLPAVAVEIETENMFDHDG